MAAMPCDESRSQEPRGQGPLLRAGSEADIDALLAVESRAARLLLEREGLELLAMHALLPGDLRRGIELGMLVVAEQEGVAVGFALAVELDGHAHLLEMDVDPAHGRRGIGALLLEATRECAATRGLGSMTLVTLRGVPWNEPFYARHGFMELDETHWGAQLRALVQRERGLGIPMSLRVVMHCPLSTR